MELSKVIDCISRKLLIGKMDTYGFSENAFLFFLPETTKIKCSNYNTWSYFNYSYLMFHQTQSSARFSLIYS